MTVKQVFNTSAELDFPNVLPSLDLDFANSKTLDPRITFTRSSGGSYVGADGFIKYAGVNEPRFDHDPATGESLGLLIEEGRTNLLTWSEAFDDVSWGKINVGIVTNTSATVAPDGTNTAEKIIEDNINSVHYLFAGFTSSANTTYTISFFAKAAERTKIRIAWAGAYYTTGSASMDYDLSLGTASVVGGSQGSSTASIIPYPNGWYRCIATSTVVNAITSQLPQIIMIDNSLNQNYQGDGVSGLYIWGAQLEQGVSSTSYIPTQASTRIRAADLASITGKNFSEWYKQIGYTIFSEHITTSPSSVFPRVFNISTSTDLFGLNHYQPPSADYVGFSAVENNINYADIIYSNITRFSKAKMATTYDLNNVVLYVNGNFVGKDTTNPYPSQNRDRINIGSATPNGQYINSTISKITYYPYTLKYSQLQSLTS